MDRNLFIDIVSGILKDHFDYVPLDISIKVTDALIEKINTTDIKDQLLNQIATYLEHTENWSKLKGAWLENGVSYDLRKLLREAIK